MKKRIRLIMHLMRKTIMRIIKFVMVFIPKKKNLILFNSWFGNKYSDNPMYLYEYMLSKKEYEIYWLTRDDLIYKKLKNEGKPVIKYPSFKAILKQIRANVLIASIGLDDFNQYFLSGCIYINLWHGIPLKEIEYDIYHYNKPEIQTQFDRRRIKYLDLLRKNIEEYIVSTSPLVTDIYMNAFHMEKKQVLELGQPRNDVFYDSKLRINQNSNLESIRKHSKLIVYMPTHRECGKIKVPIKDLLNLNIINQICKNNNAVFVIKKHYYHRDEDDSIEGYSNIIDITSDSIDTQVLLYQADVLMTDYSGCYYDYLLLDRPIIYYAYDLEEYLRKQRNMYFNYMDHIVGPLCKQKEEVEVSLNKYFANGLKDFDQKRNSLRDKYYSVDNQKEVREKIYLFIKSKIFKEENI